jgi:hypothetical protein
MNRLDLDPQLERLGDALHSSATVDLAREERDGSRVVPRARRTRLRLPVLAGSTLGLAGVGAALLLALGGTAATTPAFAVTQDANGVLLHLNYDANQNLPQANAKLAAMGVNERVTIYMAAGAASVSGPVNCAQGPGASKPVRVLVGANGTETIAAGQSAGNTAEGTFHLARCVVTGDNGSGSAGNTGNG